MRAMIRNLVLSSLCFVCAPSPGHARFDPDASLGIRVGGLFNPTDSAYGEGVARMARRMGDPRAEASGSPVAGVHLGLRLNDLLEVQVRARFWESEVAARFTDAPALDYGYSRRVVPVHSMVRLLLDGDHAGLRLAAGPGMYFVRTERSGWLGRDTQGEATLGLMLEAAFAVHLTDRVTLELAWSHERVDFEQSDRLVDDGGAGGGHGLAFVTEVTF